MELIRHRKPTHPGELLREIVLPELGISQAEFARKLGVSRQTVSELLRERRPLSPDMSIRLSKLIGRSPASWLKMQQALDLWEVEHSKKKYTDIKKLRSSKEYIA